MPAPILVTGGTGTLGRALVPLLTGAGREVRILTRVTRPDEPGVRYLVGDLETGVGVAEAVDGVDTIVHAAGSGQRDDVKARILVEAAAGHPIAHLVYISVVGAERIPVRSAVDRGMFGYFARKRAGELSVIGSGIPWTILRATQFHELTLLAMAGVARLPVAPAPHGIRFQPIAAAEVAARMAELALGAPAGLVDELGGPSDYGFDELVRSYQRATGRRRPVLGIPAPGGAAAAIRAGANLTPGHATGRQTWEEFLAEHVAAGA